VTVPFDEAVIDGALSSPSLLFCRRDSDSKGKLIALAIILDSRAPLGWKYSVQDTPTFPCNALALLRGFIHSQQFLFHRRNRWWSPYCLTRGWSSRFLSAPLHFYREYMRCYCTHLRHRL